MAKFIDWIMNKIDTSMNYANQSIDCLDYYIEELDSMFDDIDPYGFETIERKFYNNNNQNDKFDMEKWKTGIFG